MVFKPADAARLLAEMGRLCAICKLRHAVQLHHIVPREQGGSDDISNAIPLCPNCHNEVHATSGPGRVTRRYSVAELHEHLRIVKDASRQPRDELPHRSAATVETTSHSRITSIPHLRNPYFEGRDDVLAQVGGPRSGLHQYALTGVAGEGKTQIAIEYSYRAQSQFDIVWWLRAERSEVLLEDYVALGRRIGVPDRPSADAVAAATRQRLQDGDRSWLLVFDNAVAPAGLTEFIPHGGDGRVIITSRSRHWESVAEVIELDPLHSEDAVRLLLRRTGRADATSAGAVAVRLGYLALALDQAAAYMYVSGVSFGAYAGLLEERGLGQWTSGARLDYDLTLETVWEQSLSQLNADDELAATVLEWSAYLSAEGIPRELFTRPPEADFGLASEDRLVRATKSLGDYSLVRLRADSWTLHRLVQSFVRTRSSSRARQILEAVSSAINAHFPRRPEEPGAWDLCGRLLPHVLSVVRHAQEHGAAILALARASDRAGIFLNARASYGAAQQILRTATGSFEACGDIAGLAGALTHLARVERNLGDLDGALHRAGDACTRLEAQESGPQRDVELAAALTMLARIHSDLGRPDLARGPAENAFMLIDGNAGADPADLSSTFNHFGRLLLDAGEWDRAEIVLRRALAVDQEHHAGNHPHMAWTLDNLGMVLYAKGLRSEGQELVRRALSIEEAVNGRDHPRVAWSLVSLAAIVRDDDPRQAEALLSRALRIESENYGDEHLRTVQTRSALAVLRGDSTAAA
jgi:tetratricopeptide (TPR) repeat protein